MKGLRARFPRLALFLAVAMAVAALDLATKWWAASVLATFEHPQPILVGDSMQGKTMRQLLDASRFPMGDVKDVFPLFPALAEVKGSDSVPVDRYLRDFGYYVWLAPGRSSPPIFIDNPARRAFERQFEAGLLVRTLDRVLTLVKLPKVHDILVKIGISDEWRKWRDIVLQWKDTKLTYAQLLEGQLPFLDDGEAEEMLRQGLVHPIPMESGNLRPNVPRFSDSTPVSAGEVYLLGYREIPLIPSLLRFIYAENPGAAWGVLSDASVTVRVIFLQVMTGLAMLLIVFVAVRLGHEKDYLTAVALAGIMGGAIGNFVERISRFAVVDFIDMYIGTSHWPTYNVADIGITLGVGIIALQVIRKKNPF
ncbi:MAG: signal peptidase II [Deltaproteobacteria bacterium]|nr:signal peptidase II [Deltaproteobacteria bacterium]